MYMMLVDTSRCISCRACQVACKMWHALPAETNNEPRTDLTGTTFTLVKETEAEVKRKLMKNGDPVPVVENKMMRLFFKDQCRHCVAPKCKAACPNKAISREASGAVVVNADLCNPTLCVDIWGNYPCKLRCPYHILRLDTTLNKMRKCDFCFDRIRERKFGSTRATACADACPSGAIYFGTVKEVVSEAAKRLAKIKNRYPDARLGGFVNSTRVRWILAGTPSLYGLTK